MSTINVVRFFIYSKMSLSPEKLHQLVNLAYLTARDRKLYPKEILIRSDVHNTTKIFGKYQKDPEGPHTTLCYKDDGYGPLTKT
ncbi:hypothetical protein ED733_000054 [Metarhizium rileyi]|uniref:Uncharacterized protein n=1 Tax=Metarhizium rileyi (strain RCEF 4871) TaxID=1649241 RepID=A0A5C6GB06_METRR|nr:hypothetical protein ED733_000054 [Metarhizium rileyi]